MSAALLAALAATTAVITASPAAALDAGDDAIRAKYAELGATGPANGPLGPINPTADGGKFAEFAKWGTMVAITWRSDVGAHWFSGAIRARWVDAGGADKWGHAAIDQEATTGGFGAAVRYTSDISVYYSPSTGAKALFGPVRGKYWQLGSVTGIAGFPITDVQPDPAVAGGEFADFQNVMLSIYSSPATGAHWLSGAIRNRFRFHGSAALGLPTSDQFATAGADGNYVLFGPSRAIIYGPQTGAWLVADEFLDHLRALGDVADNGLPKNERTPLEQRPTGSYQHFQFATITASPETGVHSVAFQLRGEWWARGGYVVEGLPISEEVFTDTGPDPVGNPTFTLSQSFENDFIECRYLYEVATDTLFYNCDRFAAASTAESGAAGLKPVPAGQIPPALAGRL
ncbi:MAG TPA: hypothetical protein VGX25_01005 [Actinophytocola sp.]|uniref:hypothetical protein n=1 Tax=Actinophytocola sp. TaxID=1872138 RepID=UPI002DDD1087|nr:hypothetical protein [Actinophytocola sp.]HEV2777955.1 hypothetical protein [Actinophytocola sp.]